jgi:hypothetical protein
MRSDIYSIRLPETFKGDTWDGMTWRLADVPAGATEFAGTLTLARFQLQSETGEPALTLSSATAGQVTITNAAPNQWQVTVEPRALTIAAGTYRWGLETTDSTGLVKIRIGGTLKIKPDLVA